MTGNHSPFRLLALTLLMATAAALLSCNEQAKTEQSTLPKVTDLAPAGSEGLEPAKPVLDEDDQAKLNLRAQLAVERLMFRRADWKVDVALRSLEEAPLAADVKAALNASGFHVAQLPLDRLTLFRANLPPTLLVQVSKIMPMANYSPITLVSNVRGTYVGRAADAAGNLQRITMTGGSYRMLGRLAADDQGQTLVDLVPQHYFPKVTPQLRPPGERVMDGQVFESMRIRQTIAAGQVWLIWADALPPSSNEVNAEMGDRSGPMKMDQPEAKAQQPEPPLLGTMMLNGLRGQQPVRLVLVVYVKQ